ARLHRVGLEALLLPLELLDGDGREVVAVPGRGPIDADGQRLDARREPSHALLETGMNFGLLAHRRVDRAPRTMRFDQRLARGAQLAPQREQAHLEFL